MSEWRDTTLGDVLTLQRGFDLPAQDRIDGPYPIVSSSGVTGHHAVAKVEPPGVVIGRYGSLGSVHWLTEPYWPHNTALWVKDFKGNDPRFANYLLQTISHDGSAAAAVPGVNRNHLHALPVRVPKVGTQRRVAAVLAAFDRLIAINERRIDVLENLSLSLYREWFVQLRFPGHDGSSADSGPPSGWREATLGDVVTVNEITVKSHELPNPLEYLDISSVSPRRIDATKTMSATEAPGRARRRLRDGDTVWATVRPNRRSHALVHNPLPNMIASTGLVVLTPTGVPSSFLFESTSAPGFSDFLMGRATGAAYPAVRPADFEVAPLLIPPEHLVSAFAGLADPALRLASQLSVINRRLARTRDLLLPRLVTGRLDISDVDLGALTPAETG